MTANSTSTLTPTAAKLLFFLEQELDAAVDAETEAENALVLARQTVSDYRRLISQLTASLGLANGVDNTEPSANNATLGLPTTQAAPSDTYNTNGTQAEKIDYVAVRPEKYGYTTFPRAGSLLGAVLKEEKAANSSLSKEDLKNIPFTVSRMVKRGQLLRLVEKGSQGKFHFVSARWFDADGNIKPEYADAVKKLQLPNQQIENEKAASSLELLAAKESTSVAAEGDESEAETEDAVSPS